ncbi:MAG: DUF1326 domain-containing protein, partial [Burkholderiales bacterium]
MNWHISGHWREACNCKMTCPCNLGKCEPDMGWCGVAVSFDIREGKSDAVDLG